MSNKRNFTTFLGVAVATVIAAGGSAFLTDTGLSIINNEVLRAPLETESGLTEKETEQPITVETFAPTKDSFVIAMKTTGKTQIKDEKKPADKKEEDEKKNQGENGTSNNTASSSGYYDENGNYYDASGNYVAPSSSSNAYATGYANIRNQAGGSDSVVIGGLADGESVYVTGYTDNGWVQISYNGTTGYVYQDYISTGGGSGSGSESGSGSGSGSGNGGGYSNPEAWDDSYMMYDVNSRYLSKSELSGWDSWSLAALRNEIFARHGRIFTSSEWRNYFMQKTWYVPTYDADYFDSNMEYFLNDYEWSNLDLILKIEG